LKIYIYICESQHAHEREVEDFRENKIDATSHVAMVMYDGKYTVYPITSKDQPDKRRAITDLWGLCDGNKLYFRISEVFVPLVKRNNTFYFIASISDFYKPGDPERKTLEALERPIKLILVLPIKRYTVRCLAY
jgi:hypothetical protein